LDCREKAVQDRVSFARFVLAWERVDQAKVTFDFERGEEFLAATKKRAMPVERERI